MKDCGGVVESAGPPRQTRVEGDCQGVMPLTLKRVRIPPSPALPGSRVLLALTAVCWALAALAAWGL